MYVEIHNTVSNDTETSVRRKIKFLSYIVHLITILIKDLIFISNIDSLFRIETNILLIY